jgi:hypothetical protein
MRAKLSVLALWCAGVAAVDLMSSKTRPRIKCTVQYMDISDRTPRTAPTPTAAQATVGRRASPSEPRGAGSAEDGYSITARFYSVFTLYQATLGGKFRGDVLYDRSRA